MCFIKRLAAVLAASLGLSANAVTLSTDFSDLWSILPAEGGWGVNVVQQNDTLFLTLFVYGPNNQPTWYVGSDVRLQGTAQDGSIVFEGTLYSTTGPWFGASTFDPSAVTPVAVGLVQFAASDINQARLVYSVGQTLVTKAVRRQTFAVNNLTGSYRGASLGTYAGCTASENGYREQPAVIEINHPAGLSGITIREETAAYTCSYNGVFSQAGRVAQINANGTCTDGRNAVFIATEVQASIEGLTMRYLNNFGNNCTAVGRMGGVRRGS